jgi:purine-cytosine permease-like protein
MGISQATVHHLAQVPAGERRSPLTMGLVWITMVTSFPTVLIGFEWCKQGFSLAQVLTCTVLSSLLLICYAVPATQLGARSGLGYGALSRGVFGRAGTILVAANLVWMFTTWYGMVAFLMAQAVRDLLHVPVPMIWLSMLFAFLMAFNNFFGFSGVANFARYVAAPALICWVGYTFVKAASAAPPNVFTEPSHQSMMSAMTAISSFVIGFAVWGNEKDYWRYSKTGWLRSAVPLMVALLIGEIIFPTTGWLLSKTSGIVESSAATAFMNSYSFGGIAVVGVLILGAIYFAANDSNLFGLATTLESVWPMPHKVSVTIFAVSGAVLAAFLSTFDSSKALDALTALNCVFMPVPTVIMLMDWYMNERIFRQPVDFSDLPPLKALPFIRFPALIAAISGICVGVLTSGLIPGCEALHVGIVPIQAWLTAAIIFAVLRYFEYKRDLVTQRIKLENSLKLAQGATATCSHNDPGHS